MKTYQELKDNFFEEVGKVDVGKLSLGFCGLKDYAELLKVMAEIPDKTVNDKLDFSQYCCSLGSSITPRVEEGGK